MSCIRRIVLDRALVDTAIEAGLHAAWDQCHRSDT